MIIGCVFLDMCWICMDCAMQAEKSGINHVRSEEKFICPLCLATRARGSAILIVGFFGRFLDFDSLVGCAGDIVDSFENR